MDALGTDFCRVFYSIGKYKDNFRYLCCLESYLAVWKVETFQDCKTFLAAENSFPMQQRRYDEAEGRGIFLRGVVKK